MVQPIGVCKITANSNPVGSDPGGDPAGSVRTAREHFGVSLVSALRRFMFVNEKKLRKCMKNRSKVDVEILPDFGCICISKIETKNRTALVGLYYL